MIGPALNLSSRPFVNKRPVYRAALVLWVLGAVLLVANVWLYWRHFTGKGERQDTLLRLEETIAEETAALWDLEQRLAGLDLENQNREVRFLNEKIQDRTFPWSAFFDRLTEILPSTVRLQRVSPRASLGGDLRRRARSLGSQVETVGLSLAGTAESGEDLLKMVDALFDHPSFTDPNLSSEARREDSKIDFTLTVLYVDRPASGPEGQDERSSEDDSAVGSETPAEEAPEESASELEATG